MYTDSELSKIVSMFSTEGTVSGIKPLGPGFINDTFIVSTEGGPRYILQRKNHNIFPDVPGMMQNILLVTEHIKKKVEQEGGDPMREAMTVVRRNPATLSGEGNPGQATCTTGTGTATSGQ